MAETICHVVVLFSHKFVVLLRKVVYSYIVGVMSLLNTVLLQHNRGRFLSKIVKIGTLIHSRYAYGIKESFF